MAETNGGSIFLHTSPVQDTWRRWPKGSTRLYVAPRWQRDCWLNGTGVIRTEKPHGLRARAFVGWKVGVDWKFGEVTEADDWNLRLRVADTLPAVGEPLYEARPLEGPNVPADMETYGAVTAVQLSKLAEYSFSVIAKTKSFVEPFDPDAPTPPPEPSLPDLMPPGGLDFGSFLFPTPFLPADLVKAAVEILLNIGAMAIPSTGEIVLKLPEDPTAVATQIFDALKEAVDAKVVKWVNYVQPTQEEEDAIKAEIAAILTPSDPGTILFKTIPEELALQLNDPKIDSPLLGIPKDPPVKAIVARTVPRYVVAGGAEKIAGGDWVVARFKDGPRALRLKSIAQLTGGETPESHAVEFENLTLNVGELVEVFGDFRGSVEAEGSRVNDAPVDPARIALDEVPETLKPGRPVLLTPAPPPEGAEPPPDDEVPEPVPARVVAVDPTGFSTDAPASAFTGDKAFTKGNLIIRGNVVGASHGAAKPPKRLGSGVASVGNQSLLLEVENVSSVPDSTFPGGTRADIEVTIDGMIWTQVPRLNESGPTDSHYATRATESGQLRLVFGDGRHGRRLPAGANNVSVKYRVGAGRTGNLPAGSLVKQANPHALVDSVQQPRPSVGGEEMESVVTMRERAPATLLALERSVSLVDFANLAASRNDVWQARAFHHPYQSGFLEQVLVVVVPAGGGTLEPPLQEALTAYLTENAVPTVSVRVIGFEPRAVGLTVTIRVDSTRFIPTVVAEQVRATLVAKLAIERRPIARPLYISEVYHAVEGVAGVADSKCAFRADPAAVQFPGPMELGEADVVYLDATRPEKLALRTEEYAP